MRSLQSDKRNPPGLLISSQKLQFLSIFFSTSKIFIDCIFKLKMFHELNDEIVSGLQNMKTKVIRSNYYGREGNPLLKKIKKCELSCKIRYD